MADRQLRTRDLASRPEGNESNSGAEPELSAPDTAQPEQPVTRERTADAGDHPGGDTGPASRRGEFAEPAASPAEDEPLLPTDQGERFTARWQQIQTSFVDQPRDAVADADALVADLMQRLAASFSDERERLEAQWDRGDDVSTEDLRIALTRYRSFFDRLLSA